MIEALEIQVKGIVQGVGFRPFVYRLAKKYLVNGWVLNAADGVFVHAEAESKLLDEFVLELSENAPVAAQVEEIDLREVPLEDCASFEIRFSDEAEVEKTTLVSPDLATCDDCVRELFNPNDRRYRYPFINCTNCGPRFTIIEKLPYDRASTSMSSFAMCSRCAAEYADPLDRRFHAQPDACFECGPHVSFAWRQSSGASPDADPGVADSPTDAGQCENGLNVVWGRTREESDAIFARAVEVLLAGGILAVKGLGGFHLVCDANNPQAVARLRQRKQREGKAFAVMMSRADDVRCVCEVSEVEQAVLEGSQRPIVLLHKRAGACFVPRLADDLPELGVMLPYTPVQHLLMHDFAEACRARAARADDASGVGDWPAGVGGQSGVDGQLADEPGGCLQANPPMLVMTSGNLHDEPIVIDDADAYEKLACVADAFLGNDRAIRARYDDSVVRVVRAGSAGKAVQFIRRARGYAPVPLTLAKELGFRASDNAVAGGGVAAGGSDAASSSAACPLPSAPVRHPALFAAGPEQKNTFTILREGEAFLSQHIGDMENAATFDAWLAAKQRYETLFDVAPVRIACDAHPEYLSSKWAHEQQRSSGIPLSEVYHHHAHVVSVMAEHGLAGPVCGIAFDGTGYGADGRIWGGEVLLSNLVTFERFANFAYVPMPGGASAVKHPLRMAYGVLWAFDLLEHPGAADALADLGEWVPMAERMIEQGINTPLTSSVGRLFDAASALLGICTAPLYEGEPAILLEAAIGDVQGSGAPISGASNSGMSVSDEHAAFDDADSDTGSDPGPTLASSTGANNAASAADRYAIAIVKNTAMPDSTAQDTSVLLFDAASTFKALLDDRAAGVPVPVIARRFHDAFVQSIVNAAELVRAMYGINVVALSGGVFMNRYLLEATLASLESAGFTAAVNRDLPPNDGCISFGQAVVAWAQNEANGSD